MSDLDSELAKTLNQLVEARKLLFLIEFEWVPEKPGYVECPSCHAEGLASIVDPPKHRPDCRWLFAMGLSR